MYDRNEEAFKMATSMSQLIDEAQSFKCEVINVQYIDHGKGMFELSSSFNNMLSTGFSPNEIKSKGNWIDLYIAEDIDMKAGEFVIIPLGVAMKLPKGYEAIVAPRSSTFKKYGIIQANSLGVIDNSYCGSGDEWGFPAYATRDIYIEAGTRLCQFRIFKNQPDIVFIKTEQLSDNNRGGFGSTGD